ncbi:3-isopropylmalate dehydratase large subunit [Streptomyces sp. NPDC054962]
MTAKILARAASAQSVDAGDVITAGVDVLAVPDTERFIDFINDNQLKVWDPRRIVFCFDHFFEDWLPSGAVRKHPKIRQFAQEQGIPEENIYDVGRNGLSHQVPVEEGWVLPGTVSLGADTQAATMGAMNCFTIPTLSSGTTSVVLTGRLWQVVPECVSLRLHGRLPRGVLGKDVVYRLIKDLGGVIGGRVVEVSGPGVESLPVDVRMAIANGAIQMGAQTIVFPADRVLLDYLGPRARGPFTPVAPDPDAEYSDTFDYDLGDFEPLVSGPHDIDLIRPVSELAGLTVTAAYIGSCASGRFEDLSLAAEILRNTSVHPNVRMVVTPISATVARQAEEAGILQVLESAGATVTRPGCGACYHGNASPLKLADGERCVSASVENVAGRMGSASAEIYLGSAAVVAASAAAGRLIGPADFLD